MIVIKSPSIFTVRLRECFLNWVISAIHVATSKPQNSDYNRNFRRHRAPLGQNLSTCFQIIPWIYFDLISRSDGYFGKIHVILGGYFENIFIYIHSTEPIRVSQTKMWLLIRWGHFRNTILPANPSRVNPGMRCRRRRGIPGINTWTTGASRELESK